MRRKNYISFLIIVLALQAYPSFAQFRDFRIAKIIKSNGDSAVGKVAYRLKFDKNKTILFRTGNSTQEISINELDKIIFSNGETYSLISLNNTTNQRVLARQYVEGKISLYKANDLYYVKKDTSIFELYDKHTTVVRNSKSYSTHSKKYLSALNLAFIDCRTLDYKPFEKRITLRPLVKIINQYNACKGIFTAYSIPKSEIEIAFFAGPSFSKFNSSFIPGTHYNSIKTSSFALSFLKDLTPTSNRFKLRLDLNYFKSELKGAFTRTIDLGIFGSNDEYVTFSSGNKGFRIPIGLQYYFFNNTSALYIAGGIFYDLNKYDNLKAEGYTVYRSNNKDEYEPFFETSFEVSRKAITGVWAAVGCDVNLSRKLKLNVELRGVNATYEVLALLHNGYEYVFSEVGMSINEFNPTLGLKYKVR